MTGNHVKWGFLGSDNKLDIVLSLSQRAMWPLPAGSPRIGTGSTAHVLQAYFPS